MDEGYYWNFEDEIIPQFSGINSIVVARNEDIKNNYSTTLPAMNESVCTTVQIRKVSISEAIACFISILTVLENVAILIAIKRGPRTLRKPPYWFIASLAAADLLTGFEVVLAIFVPVGTSPLSRIALKGLAVVTFIASINSLLCVSFDRYMRIAHYADYDRYLTRRRVIILIFFSWFVSVGVFLITPLLGGLSCAAKHCCADNGLCVCKRSEFGDYFCSTNCSQSFVPFSKYYLLFGLIYFFIAVSIMIGFYTALFKKAKKRMFDRRGSVKETKPMKRDVQLAKTLIITLLVFVICWLPLMALFLADLIITENTAELSKNFDYALVPSVVNSLLNPIIYSVRLPHMRFTLKKIFFSCVCKDSKSFFNSAWTTNTSMDRSMRRSRALAANREKKNRLASMRSSEESSNVGVNSIAAVTVANSKS